jgi:hypothetical protein
MTAMKFTPWDFGTGTGTGVEKLELELELDKTNGLGRKNTGLHRLA